MRRRVHLNAWNNCGNRLIRYIGVLSVKSWLICLERGLEQCEHRSPSGIYPQSRRCYQPPTNPPEGYHRCLTTKMVYSRWTNRYIHLRKWLLYSPSKCSGCCYYCSQLNKNGYKFSHPDGFSSWKKGHSKTAASAQSEAHRNCFLEAHDRVSEAGRVDWVIDRQGLENKRYWCDTMHNTIIGDNIDISASVKLKTKYNSRLPLWEQSPQFAITSNIE